MKNKFLQNIITRINIFFLSFIITIISSVNLNAQYKPNQEFGILGGTGYYVGDLNKMHFNNLRVAGGITFRKNFDRRFSFKSSVL